MKYTVLIQHFGDRQYMAGDVRVIDNEKIADELVQMGLIGEFVNEQTDEPPQKEPQSDPTHDKPKKSKIKTDTEPTDEPTDVSA